MWVGFVEFQTRRICLSEVIGGLEISDKVEYEAGKGKKLLE